MGCRARYPFDNPLEGEFLADPYPSLIEARRDYPVHHIQQYDMWLVSRYEDVRAVLMDAETFSSVVAHRPLFPEPASVQDYLAGRNFCPALPISGSDGARHKRIRSIVARALALTPANLSKIRKLAEDLAETMVDALPKAGEFDIVSLLTSKFPAHVIYRIIGFPPSMDQQMLDWSADKLRMTWSVTSEEEQLLMATRMADYWDWCVSFARECLNNPGEDVTGNLLRMHLANPEKLSLNEVTSILYGLVFAGHETTANSTGQTLRLLLEEPARWEDVKRNPDRVIAYFNEALRIAPPVAAWRRSATRDVNIGGVDISAGANLLLHFGSAGHDERKFANGEAFDPDRPGNDAHLAFSQGPHFCLGAPLAKLEAEVLLQALARQAPGLRMVEGQEIKVISTISFRGPSSLLVRQDRPLR